jgi:hypothetical protein
MLIYLGPSRWISKKWKKKNKKGAEQIILGYPMLQSFETAW